MTDGIVDYAHITPQTSTATGASSSRCGTPPRSWRSTARPVSRSGSWRPVEHRRCRRGPRDQLSAPREMAGRQSHLGVRQWRGTPTADLPRGGVLTRRRRVCSRHRRGLRQRPGPVHGQTGFPPDGLVGRLRLGHVECAGHCHPLRRPPPPPPPPDARPTGTMDLGTSSYRMFEAEWEGRPADAPVVVRGDESVVVSWNGATEVASWEVVSGEEGVVAHADATGFETVIALDGLDVDPELSPSVPGTRTDRTGHRPRLMPRGQPISCSQSVDSRTSRTSVTNAPRRHRR